MRKSVLLAFALFAPAAEANHPIEYRLQRLEQTVRYLEGRVQTLERNNGGGGYPHNVTCTLQSRRGYTYTGYGTDRVVATENARRSCAAAEGYYECQNQPAYCRN